MQLIKRSLALGAVAIVMAALAPAARAHFPWLAVDDDGRALLFFGESPEERAYKLPEQVAKATVFSRAAEGQRTELALQAVEEEDFIGRRSAEPVAKGAALEATCEYGLYHGMLLTYYARRLPGGPDGWQALGQSTELPLQVSPSTGPQGLTLTVTWKGAPREGAGVMLVDGQGNEHQGETDAEGRVLFRTVAAGLAGATANFVDDAKGEHQGKPYESAGHYATLTFNFRGVNGPGAADDPTAGAAATSPYPELAEPVSSFGGAVCDGYLYVYSGHTGTEHAHSRDNLSQSFSRLKLNGGGAWEELPMQTPLQGLPLVAHGGKLYRVGGLSVRNAAGEEDDLHSVAEFACYDPRSRQWTALPPLPEPRSSHDATVIRDTLYVVGGWKLAGSSDGTWLDTAWAYDLTAPTGQWKSLPSPPFRRRALALGTWKGRLVAVGGMTEDHDISRSVDVLDLQSGEWSKAAELPGNGMDGFGVSIWNQNERLFAVGTQDSAYALAGDGSAWKAVANLRQPRFFHRLLPGEGGQLIAVAGASETGHLKDVEPITPELPRRPEE